MPVLFYAKHLFRLTAAKQAMYNGVKSNPREILCRRPRGDFMYCTDRMEDLLRDSRYAGARVFNLYGDQGMGKTHIAAELMEARRKAGTPCGYLDFNEYKGLSAHTTLNALYQICDYLTIKHSISLTQFEIADEVNCERWGRIPYCQRKKDVVASTIDQASDLSGLVVDVISEFRELPYIGLGINLLQRASKIAYAIYHTHSPAYLSHKAFREACQGMSDLELLRQLPLSLAHDVENAAQTVSPNHRILVVVDNCHETRLDNSWMDTLISHTGHITWLFLSRAPLQYAGGDIVSIPVSPLDKEQLRHYLNRRTCPKNDTLLDRLLKTSGGVPLRIERMLEYAARKGWREDSDWAQMEALSYKNIAQELLNNLSVSEKEILFQLNFAQSFDEALFSRMFPGRLFGLYRNWFQSSLFLKDEFGRYQVQGSIREEIASYMLQFDESLEKTCKEKLYQTEYSWFRDLDLTAKYSISECDYHLRNLLAYGMEAPSADQYARDLIGLRRTLLELGYTTEYCYTLSQLAPKASDAVRLSIFQEIALLYLRLSNFPKCREAIEQGLKLLSPHDAEHWITFSLILMELEYISPSGDQNAVQHCIEIAENLIQVLDANISSIPFKDYVNSMVKAHLYLAKAYIVRNDYVKGAQYASYVLDLCADAKKCSALALHASHAKAQEYMGEISDMNGNGAEALARYQSAAENYQLAEAAQPYWDASFYLDFGLIYNRIAEASLSLAKAQTSAEKRAGFETAARTSVARALKKYDEVRSRRPELIDTYCKTGFACNMFLEYFWNRDEFQAEVERCFEQANNNLQAAFQIVGRDHKNRQLANISCTLTCIHGRYLAHAGKDAEAEQAFRQSMQYGRTAVSAAPKHPYGYLVSAECCLAFGAFLHERGRKQEAEVILRDGLSCIQTAEHYAGNSNRHFQSIQDGLLQYLRG